MPAPAEALSAGILIVDDQASNLRLLEHALSRAGYSSVASTDSPTEVCDLHRQNRYHLIILDVQMPRMNGFEVMEALAGVEGERAAILILSADPTHTIRALEAGAAGFLSKPFVLAELVARVGLVLEKKVAQSATKSNRPRPPSAAAVRA